ncbi:uncharacterized protein LOC132039148 [Lycium ferocissimum]|uniref:uncharacterized protein LOC132039148 n=1 Tax=Lycium ferocissimum TaxID=112874 RepID=UPI0028160293|nr:uncharacterized protein LOC132039148 [Lycium ferocissimum]
MLLMKFLQKLSVEAELEKEVVKTRREQENSSGTKEMNEGPDSKRDCLDIVPLSTVVVSWEDRSEKEPGLTKSSAKKNPERKEINSYEDIALGKFLKCRTKSAHSKVRKSKGKPTSAREKGPPITRRRATSQLYSALQGNKEKSTRRNRKLAKVVNLSRLIDEEKVVTVSDKEEEEEETEEEAPLERNNSNGKKRSVIDEKKNVGKVEAEKVTEKIGKEKEVTPSPKKRKSPVSGEVGPFKKRKVISTEGPGSSKKGKSKRDEENLRQENLRGQKVFLGGVFDPEAIGNQGFDDLVEILRAQSWDHLLERPALVTEKAVADFFVNL